MKENEIIYLGDGLYARYDGCQIELMANSPDNPTDTVYLEPNVLKNFILYAKELGLLPKEGK